jgi:drug/metabolite transporter (DMT)-like permease
MEYGHARQALRLSHNSAVLLMLAVTLMWSIAGVVTRHLEQARSFEVTFWRSFFTALSLLVFLPLLRGKAVIANIRQGGTALMISGLLWAGMFTFFMLALTLTTVANVLVISALTPLFTALGARIFIGHQIALRTWAAIVVAGVGIAYMYGSQLGQGINLLGALAALAVPIGGAANWTLNQHAHAHGKLVDLIPAVLIGGVVSALVTLPLAWPLQASTHDMGLLGLLGLVQLAIPCSLAIVCARVLKAPEMALLGMLEVIFGILLAWVGAGEVPAANVLIGGVMVVAALVLNELVAWRGRA